MKLTCRGIRAELVRWVLESMQPFSIVSDQGFQTLMKTGRLSYYIPSVAVAKTSGQLVALV